MAVVDCHSLHKVNIHLLGVSVYYIAAFGNFENFVLNTPAQKVKVLTSSCRMQWSLTNCMYISDSHLQIVGVC